MDYQPVRNKPCAKFWYKGNHTHPVRRTVLIIEINNDLIIGYELREGNETRLLKNAPIKSYRKDRMASSQQLRLNNPLRKIDGETYQRENIINLLESGI